jgi:hypothetical protein
MAQFQKYIKIFFSNLHGHSIYCQQWELSEFLLRYWQFASHAYCAAARPVSKMALQQEKAFCLLRFEVPRYVITVQCEFRARFKKGAPHKNNVCELYAKKTCSLSKSICRGHLHIYIYV